MLDKAVSKGVLHKNAASVKNPAWQGATTIHLPRRKANKIRNLFTLTPIVMIGVFYCRPENNALVQLPKATSSVSKASTGSILPP